MLAEIQAFLALLESPPSDADERMQALAVALDRLAFAYHALPQGDFSDIAQERPEREASDYDRLRNQAVAGFPDLNNYPVCDPLALAKPEIFLGDPHDDLADIANDLTEGLWEWQHNGAGHAAWQLRLHHWHWGQHLRCLRYYIFCKMQPELNPT